MTTDYSEIHTTDDGRITVYPNALRPCTDCGEPIGTDAGSWNGPGQGLRHSTCPQAADKTTATTITLSQLVAGYHSPKVTNLGPRFTCSLPGMTEVTIALRAGDVAIPWVNTYGNVYANAGHYQLSQEAHEAALSRLHQIQTRRTR